MLVPAAKPAIPEFWDLLSGAALITIDSERSIVMGTKPEGSVLIYAGLQTYDNTARRSLEEASGPDQRVARCQTKLPKSCKARPVGPQRRLRKRPDGEAGSSWSATFRKQTS
jgi:hypothetical protein